MSRLLAALAVVILPGASTLAQDRRIFTVGTATAARGQKATGTIEVPAGSDAALSIPSPSFMALSPGRCWLWSPGLPR
jgi:hypothetical protein